MKSYISSCPKSDFKYIARTVNTNKYIVRWNPIESTQGEGESAIQIYTYNETVVDKKPNYGSVVNLLVKEKYTDADELAMARQSYASVEDYKAYNDYVEQCKKWAADVVGVEYKPTFAPTQAEVMTQLRTLVKDTVTELPDEKAIDVPSLFDPWQPNENVAKDVRKYYTGTGKLYRCVQPHKTQIGWEPDKTPALWTEVSVEEWPEWKRPTGAQDAYNKGDKVTFEGEHYISLIDANVYSPKEYPQGWEKQV